MRQAFLVTACAMALTTSLAGQTATAAAPAAPPPSLKSLGMVIYPAQKQTPEQQAKDEASCTSWAESQTGIKITGGQVNTQAAGQAAKQQTAEATQGAAVVGSAKGAVAGVAIGAIAGDAGTGAAIGAVAGAAAGRRKKKQAEAQAEQAGAQQAQAQNQAAIDQFKKAAGACLTGRGYTVS
jgi:hypothetical protein